jgi:hypothetical protein
MPLLCLFRHPGVTISRTHSIALCHDVVMARSSPLPATSHLHCYIHRSSPVRFRPRLLHPLLIAALGSFSAFPHMRALFLTPFPCMHIPAMCLFSLHAYPLLPRPLPMHAYTHIHAVNVFSPALWNENVPPHFASILYNPQRLLTTNP